MIKPQAVEDDHPRLSTSLLSAPTGSPAALVPDEQFALSASSLGSFGLRWLHLSEPKRHVVTPVRGPLALPRISKGGDDKSEPAERRPADLPLVPFGAGLPPLLARARAADD